MAWRAARKILGSETAHRTMPAIPPDAEIGFAAHGERHGKHDRPTECLNCGRKPLYTNFCPDCGQENHHSAVPLHVLLEDVFEEFLKWDGRLLRTLGMLLLRPGRLTAEYNAGRRVRYMSPFKLYLGITTLFFVAVFLPPTLQTMQQRLHELPPIKRNGASLKRKKDSATNRITGKEPGISVSSDINKKPRQQSSVSIETKNDSFSDLSIFGESELFMPAKFRGDRPIVQGHLLDEYDIWQQDKRNAHKHKGLRHIGIQQILKCIDDPQHFAQEMVEAAAKAMFFLMPVYALILGALFRTPRKYFVEHLVFAINHHTFAFFLVTLLVIAAETQSPWGLILLPVYTIYEFAALRVCYKQSKRLTLFKQFILNQFYFLIVLVGLIVTALVTVAFL